MQVVVWPFTMNSYRVVQCILGQKIIVRPQIIENLLLIRRESIVSRSRTSTNWNDTLTATGPVWVKRLLNMPLVSVTVISIYALAFVLKADIFSTQCNKDDMIWHVWRFWETLRQQLPVMFVAIQLIIKLYVDSSIWLFWHFKFPKVVQAHILGEVGILWSASLRAYSGTIFPIFIEIGSYLTDKEQNISWHGFLDTLYIAIIGRLLQQFL